MKDHETFFQAGIRFGAEAEQNMKPPVFREYAMAMAQLSVMNTQMAAVLQQDAMISALERIATALENINRYSDNDLGSCAECGRNEMGYGPGGLYCHRHGEVAE